MLMLILLILLMLVFITPTLGSWLYIAIIFLLELVIILAGRNKIRVKNNDNKYTNEEIRIIEKWPLFFQYPMASRSFSSFFSGVQVLSFIFIPFMLIKGYWPQMIVGILQYFIAPQFAVPLNPQHFLRDNLTKGRIKNHEYKIEFEKDYKVLESALDKMYLKKS